jgi:hypothetical protein
MVCQRLGGDGEMRKALSLAYYSVMVPIFILYSTVDGFALLLFGRSIFPGSSYWYPINEFLASIVGQRLADAIAGVALLATAYVLFGLVRGAFGKSVRRGTSDNV